MSYQVLARRWRPLTFDAVVGQAPIVRTLRNALAQERIAHAYLFAGPRGVGKTTTARLLAMGVNCEGARTGGAVPCAACEPCREVAAGRALDVLEIDARPAPGGGTAVQIRARTFYEFETTRGFTQDETNTSAAARDAAQALMQQCAQ